MVKQLILGVLAAMLATNACALKIVCRYPTLGELMKTWEVNIHGVTVDVTFPMDQSIADNRCLLYPRATLRGYVCQNCFTVWAWPSAEGLEEGIEKYKVKPGSHLTFFQMDKRRKDVVWWLETATGTGYLYGNPDNPLRSIRSVIYGLQVNCADFTAKTFTQVEYDSLAAKDPVLRSTDVHEDWKIPLPGTLLESLIEQRCRRK